MSKYKIGDIEYIPEKNIFFKVEKYKPTEFTLFDDSNKCEFCPARKIGGCDTFIKLLEKNKEDYYESKKYTVRCKYYFKDLIRPVIIYGNIQRWKIIKEINK